MRELTALKNQTHQHLAQIDPGQSRRPLATPADLEAVAALAVPAAAPLRQAHLRQVRLLVARMQVAIAQIAELTAEIDQLSASWTAPLQTIVGVGSLTAGMLAAHLGGKTFRSDAALAMYAGVAPLDASSGEQNRHRLNRRGNRQLNAVLHRIALTQSRCCAKGKAYLAKKQAEGKTRKEAFRCLKRLLARVILTAWNQCTIPSLSEINGILT